MFVMFCCYCFFTCLFLVNVFHMFVCLFLVLSLDAGAHFTLLTAWSGPASSATWWAAGRWSHPPGASWLCRRASRSWAPACPRRCRSRGWAPGWRVRSSRPWRCTWPPCDTPWPSSRPRADRRPSARPRGCWRRSEGSRTWEPAYPRRTPTWRTTRRTPAWGRTGSWPGFGRGRAACWWPRRTSGTCKGHRRDARWSPCSRWRWRLALVKVMMTVMIMINGIIRVVTEVMETDGDGDSGLWWWYWL